MTFCVNDGDGTVLGNFMISISFYNLDKNPSGESEKIYYFLISFAKWQRERCEHDSNCEKYQYLRGVPKKKDLLPSYGTV